MDATGIVRSVLYPSVAGVGGEDLRPDREILSWKSIVCVLTTTG